MSRHVQPGNDNHDRWLVSYADFITLMFAFFVVMFASSQADRSKAKRVSESVTRALEDGPGAKRKVTVFEFQVGPSTGQGKEKSAAGASLYQAGARSPAAASAQAAELLPSLEYLSTQLRNEIVSGKMHISLEARGLVVSLRQATFFPSGEDTIDPATYPSLQKVATAICQLPNPVRLEGHTDAIPIHTTRFRSNWDLSAARAIAVLQLLTIRFNVPLQRLAIAGYAETIPIAANDTEEGRARNRRVDIVILNRQQLVNEPAPADAERAIPRLRPSRRRRLSPLKILMPQCETKYFGTVSYDQQTVITFPAGLPAFENRRHFLPIEDAARRPFVFLQSLEDPGLCFLTLSVTILNRNYQLKMSAEDLAVIGLRQPLGASTSLQCLAVVSFNRDGNPTANLLAPIVVNGVTCIGVQSVRDDSAYGCSYPLPHVPQVAPCS